MERIFTFGLRLTHNAMTKSEEHRLLDGVAVWDAPTEVVDLSRKYFHLDDDQNFKPSLWHHGWYDASNKISNEKYVERAREIFRAYA